MADKQLTGLNELAATPASDDVLVIHDSSASEDKKITVANALASKANTSHNHATSDITSGTMADARIAESNVTQHEAALTIAQSQVTDLTTDLGNKADASHNHAASDINSGTLAHERGGLEADVSAYNGIVKISGGSTSVAVANTDFAAATHASRHETGATDEIDGDKLDIDWNPSNYTPDSGITEADSTDNLSAHLKGIDTALATAGGSNATQIRSVDIDSSVGTPSDGNILVYRDAGSDWVLEAKPASGSNPAINDISDVAITSVADNEVLAYDNSSGDWINQTAAEAGLAAASHNHTLSDITDSGVLAGEDTVGTSLIDNDAVTYAKIQNVSATNRILGRDSAGAGVIEEITPANLRTMINVEDGADVTDTTNVDAAGAVMNSDTSTASMSFVIDEDNMATNTATQVPTQQSVKSYVDNFAGSSNITTVGTVTSGNVDAVVSAASTTTAGKVEIATSAETTTGTDATRAISPDGLAQSSYGMRYFQVTVQDYETDVATNDVGYLHIPAEIDGYSLKELHAEVISTGTTGTTDISVDKSTERSGSKTWSNMLTTDLTIDSGEYGSDTATAAVIKSDGTEQVAENNLVRVQVDSTSTTAPKGLIVTLGFQLP
jgi:hypothetical protein